MEGKEGTYKGDSARLWVQLDVSGQISAGHPLRHNLEGVKGYAYKRDDVDVC